MGDWKLLGSILEDVHAHSTIVGKIWLTVLFVFRMLVLGVAAEEVWEDEQAEFVCNTHQPGCKAVCYDRAFPISLVRFWMLQVVFVSAPSLFFMGHTLYRIRNLEKGRHRRRVRLREEMDEMDEAEAAPKEEHKRMERELRRLHERRRVKTVPLRGSLLRTYIIHILTRSVVEVCFILGQWVLYGVRVDPLYRCSRLPCPNVVDCYVSRPTEKTIFMVFMVAIASVSLFLNVLEISHLGARKIKQTLNGEKYSDDDSLTSEPLNKPFAQHLCVMSHVSRQSGLSTQTVPKLTPEVNTRPPHYNTEVKPDHESSSHNSSAHSTGTQPIESLQRISPPLSAPAVEGPQCRESQELLSSPAEQHILPTCRTAPSGGKADPKNRAPRDDPHSGNHLQPRSMEALVSSSTVVHRPSVVVREEVKAWRGSLGSGLLFPNPRKTSFMARPPSDSMSNISGSSNSVHSSEESDELGSLHGDMSMMSPAGGRRMSMSVFLDISSIMKK